MGDCRAPGELTGRARASTTGGTVANLGLFEARVGSATCSTTTQDAMTGEPVTTTMPVTSAQFEACQKALVGSAFYPASCPR